MITLYNIFNVFWCGININVVDYLGDAASTVEEQLLEEISVVVV